MINDPFLNKPMLPGKVAVVTDSGRGIGRMLALAFANSGASVAAIDQTPASLDETVSRINQQNGSVKGYPVDLSRPGQVKSLVDEVQRDWGGIDLLINVTGLSTRALLQDLTEWEWQYVLDKNLTAPFYLIRLVSASMAAQADGVILNIGATETLAQSEDGLGAFAAANAGLISMTRTAARELDGDNVRVHAICLGELALISESDPEIYQIEEIREMMMGVAKLALYLCSPNAAHLTGQILNINRSEEE